MRRVMTVLALAVLTVGLIVGGIICFVGLPKDIPPSINLLDWGNASTLIGAGIGMFLGGICSGIMAIASFFKMKVKDCN